MSLPSVESGLLLGEFPFARVGDGARKLVILPGINDALQDVTVNVRFSAWFCQGLARGRTVYLISRRHGLRPGTTIGDLSADYARILADQIGRADVMGISMGGAIAQHLAADHPERVERLILGMIGPRLHPGTRPLCEHWIGLARDRRWRELYLDMIAKTYGPTRRAVYQALMPTAEKMFARIPSAPTDFIVAAEACMEYDTRELLEAISARTLVLGGTEDQLIPVEDLRELAERIPNATLRLFEGAGHGAFEERKEEFDRAVLEFLED